MMLHRDDKSYIGVTWRETLITLTREKTKTVNRTVVTLGELNHFLQPHSPEGHGHKDGTTDLLQPTARGSTHASDECWRVVAVRCTSCLIQLHKKNKVNNGTGFLLTL